MKGLYGTDALSIPQRLTANVLFLYFGAVSYRSKIYLNGEKIASHEGGFTPLPGGNHR